MQFKDLDFKTSDIPKGVYATVMFDNGYGASIICNDMSYGGRAGLYELAVMDKNGLTNDTDITNDVIGWQTKMDITRLLKAIQSLDKDGNLPKDVLL